MATNPFDQTNGGYFLDGVPSSYTPGSNYQISLNSTSAITFKGGIVYAVNATGYRGGSWTPASTLTQISNLGCTGDPSNSITHTSLLPPSPLTSVFLGTWTAPAASVGTVAFQGVCVRVETTWFYLTPKNVPLTPVPTTALSTAAVTTSQVTSGSLTTAIQNSATTEANSATTEANSATTEANSVTTESNVATTEQANSATTGQSNVATTSVAHVSSGNKILADTTIIVFAMIMICGVFGSS